MGIRRSTQCSRNVELDSGCIVSRVGDHSRRNNPVHLHHDIEDDQRRRPHKCHELRRSGGNKGASGLNTRVHAVGL